MLPFSRMSIFDLDHTLLNGNSSFHFGKFLYRRKAFSLMRLPFLLSCYALHKINLLSLAHLHQAIFKFLFKGRSFAFFKEQMHLFLAEELDLLWYQPAIQELRLAQERGDFVAILSGSPAFLVQAIAEKLAVDQVEGSIYALDQRGYFSHIASLLEGPAKAQWTVDKRKNLGIDKSAVTAYTDSILDLPFLLAAGTPVAANPDKQLRALCKSKKWKII